MDRVDQALAMREWRHEHPSYHTVYMRKWRSLHPKYGTPIRRDWRRKQRIIALSIVGNGTISCVSCGCNVIPILEINHINGGGRQEHLTYGTNTTKFLRSIITGKRDRKEFNILCRVCNAVEDVERRLGIHGFKVTYHPEAIYISQHP